MGLEWIHDNAEMGMKLTVKVPPRKAVDAPPPLAPDSAQVSHLCQLVESNVHGLEVENRVLSQATGATMDHYWLGKELGQGHFGVVRLCVDHRSLELLACKSIRKSNIKRKEDIKELQAEIGVMQHLSGSEHVVQLKDVFEDAESIHLVMELCKDGDLFDHIARRRRLPEAEAASIFRQIVLAVQYCHSRGVVHRDLKPENILFSKLPHNGKEEAQVKLADFGLAVMVNPGEQTTGLAGSPFYMAPELVRRQPYGPEIDIWSLGVILYTALSGFLPFWGKTHEQTFAAVCKGEADFTKKPWQSISNEAKSLVRKMLTVDRQRRCSINAILCHPWMLAHCPATAPRSRVEPLAPPPGRPFVVPPHMPTSPRDFGPNPHPVPQALSAPKGRFSPPRTPSAQSSPRAVPVKASISQFLPTPPGTPKTSGEHWHVTPFAAALAKPGRFFRKPDCAKEQTTLASTQALSTCSSAQTTPRPFFLSGSQGKTSPRRGSLLQRQVFGQRGESSLAQGGVENGNVEGKAQLDVSMEESKRVSESTSSECGLFRLESPRSHFEEEELPESKGRRVAMLDAPLKDFVI